MKDVRATYLPTYRGPQECAEPRVFDGTDAGGSTGYICVSFLPPRGHDLHTSHGMPVRDSAPDLMTGADQSYLYR